MMFILQVPIHGEGKEGSKFKSPRTSFTHTYTYGPFGWMNFRKNRKMRFFIVDCWNLEGKLVEKIEEKTQTVNLCIMPMWTFHIGFVVFLFCYPSFFFFPSFIYLFIYLCSFFFFGFWLP